jgi:hypothetical protein
MPVATRTQGENADHRFNKEPEDAFTGTAATFLPTEALKTY